MYAPEEIRLRFDPRQNIGRSAINCITKWYHAFNVFVAIFECKTRSLAKGWALSLKFSEINTKYQVNWT